MGQISILQFACPLQIFSTVIMVLFSWLRPGLGQVHCGGWLDVLAVCPGWCETAINRSLMSFALQYWSVSTFLLL